MRNSIDLSLQHQGNGFDFLNVFIATWENSSEAWGAKDRNSRFLYANDTYKKLLNIPLSFHVEGRFDSELPAPTSEFETAFQEHDRKVELLQTTLTSLEIHAFGKERIIQPYLFDKYPLYNLKKECVGTIFHGRKAYHFSTEMLLFNQEPTSFIFQPPSKIFSEREWDIIFHINQRLKNTSVAQILGISPRTVELHIRHIYAKAGVNNMRDFCEYCKVNGFDRFVPTQYLTPFHKIL